ncbi:MAG: ACT domain-containing protein [Acutalibacteraceae bacterium]|nr:ACT domain-containing protein [Acutalibacteraceae bacterium]
MKEYDMLLIKASALPDIYLKVLYAKELLKNGSCSNVSSAASKAGISRSAFYKYKDCVFAYDAQSTSKNICISAMLCDRAGVFSALTAKLYHSGVNILTINQNHPVDQIAAVTLTANVNDITTSIEELMKQLREIDGVISVKII